MTLQDEFEGFLSATYPEDVDRDSIQYRDLRFAWFAGAMVASGMSHAQLVEESLAFLAEARRVAEEGRSRG